MNSALLKGGMPVGDGTILARVSKDKMTAFLAPKEKGTVLDKDALDWKSLRVEIEDAGVVFGYLEKLQNGPQGTIIFAKGTPPEHGENARVKPHVKPSIVRSPKSKNPAKDKVDFRELGSIVNVPQEKLLLEKIPATDGKPGKNVLGDAIQPKPGKDINIKIGQGVTLSDDGMRVSSDVEGKFMLADGKASVLTEHTVSGNIDMSVGNIKFVGTKLNINGTVLPGFKIKAKKDIYIAQGVEHSQIMAGGNLEIKGGVIGDEVFIQCWGNISADFIENVGRIEVMKNLVVTDSIIQAKVRAGKNIYVMSGKGLLVGGEYIVGGSIYVKELGSTGEVQTQLSVGINPELEEKKKRFEAEKQIWPEKMNEIIKNTTALKKMKAESGGTLPEDKEMMLEKMNAMLPEVMEKVSELNKEEQVIKDQLDQTINESVYVYGTVYPGATITIGGMSRTLATEEEYVVIHFDKSTRQIHCRSMTSTEKENEPKLVEEAKVMFNAQE